MYDFNEEVLQFIWQQRLFIPQAFTTQSGLTIQIMDPGCLNTDSGPDFRDARIKLGQLELVGNIEIHIRSSDWLRHGHQYDKAYDKIILHVVYENDVPVPQNEKFGVEVLELKSYIPLATLQQYKHMRLSKEEVPCSTQLQHISDISFVQALARMSAERLEQKTMQVAQLAESYRGDFTQTFYCLLMRNMGFYTNAVPFEVVARHLPVHLLLRHGNQREQLEALLLGTAGLLEEQFPDAYRRRLQNEYSFLARKYGLPQVGKEIFKRSGLRPANSAALRLIEMAALLHTNAGFMLAPQLYGTYQEADAALTIEVPEVWSGLFSSGAKTQGAKLRLGRQSRENIMVNTLAPFLFFYGKKLHKPEYQTKALDLLEACSPENNRKTKAFNGKSAGINSAFDSQGIIQLYDTQCKQRACLQCGIGRELLKRVPPAINSELLKTNSVQNL